MFNSEVFPLHEVPKFPVNYLAVQDLFHYPLFFSVDDLWGWRRRDASAGDWIVDGWGQFDDIEYRVQAAH